MTPAGSFARLGFPVVSRDEALASAMSVGEAAQTRAPPRQKRVRRANTQSHSAPISRTVSTPPITPPTPSAIPEEGENEDAGSAADIGDHEVEQDLGGCTCGCLCVADTLTDPSRWRKPAHLLTGENVAMEPDCHEGFEWDNLICERCPAGRQLDVGSMNDEAMLAVDMNGRVKHIYSRDPMNLPTVSWTENMGIHEVKSLIHLIHHCPGLQSAHLQHCRNRDVALALMSSCPALLSIRLSKFIDYNDPVELWALAEHPEWAPDLRELSLEWTGFAPFHHVRCHMPMEWERVARPLTALANARPNLIFSITEKEKVVWARVPSWIQLEWYQRRRSTTDTTVYDTTHIEEVTECISHWV